MIASTILATLLFAVSDPAPAPVKIAEGIYVIAHPDASDDWPNSNTTVVVGDRGVLVVDSTFLPSVARADIRAIRALTDKPVRYLVNTHWHYDHNNGNAEYVKAFPDVLIVAHAETRRLMDANSRRFAAALVRPASAASQRLEEVRKRLAAGRSDGGAPLSDSETKKLEQSVTTYENQSHELASFEYAAPTLTFTQELTLDLGGLEARVINFGRGNTPGDAVVFVPRERVLASGDLVVSPVPYAYNSYPREWIGVMRQLRALEPLAIVPGHGAVQRDTRYVLAVEDLLRSVVEQVDRLESAGRTLDEIRKTIDVGAFRKAMAGDDPGLNELFDDSIVRALVERVFNSARGGV